MENDHPQETSARKQSDFAATWAQQIRVPRIKNADNEWLGTAEGANICVGHVSEVNGADAAEVEGFVPTRHELLELVKYWAKIAINTDYECFLYAYSGSTEMRLSSFAWRRVARIGDLLGDAVDRALDEVYEEFANKENKRHWAVFLHGTDEERIALQDEIWREIEKSTSGNEPSQSESPSDAGA